MIADNSVETVFEAGGLRVYNSNASLKAVGVSQKFSPFQVAEYSKCMQDPIYFIENYCYIVSLDKGLILAKLPDAVKEYVTAIHTNRKVIGMFPRQMFKTTTTAAYILWYTLFNDSKTVAIMANKAPTSQEILSRYQTMYENLPMWLQQGVLEWNKRSIKLENGSTVFTGATSRSGIRSRSVNLLYVDECAIIPNNIADDFFAAITPTISSGNTTKLIMTSTPLGYNHFWRYWDGAINKSNDFVPILIHWHEIPGRDKAWLDEQLRQLGELKFNQEVLCQFLGSSNTLISANGLQLMVSKPASQSVDGLDIMYDVNPDNLYVLIADVAKGTGGDYSAFTVLDVTQLPYKIAAKYRDNKIHPRVYPNIIHRIATYYNNCPVLVEINVGEEVATALYEDFEYDNLVTIGRTPKNQVPFGSGTFQTGVVTDKKIKRLGCNSLKHLVENQKLIVEDADIIQEFTVFIEKNGTWSAEYPNHDDLIITLVLFGWLSETVWFSNYTKSIGDKSVVYGDQRHSVQESLVGFIGTTNANSDVITIKHVDRGVVWFNADGTPHDKTLPYTPIVKDVFEFNWKPH